MPIFLSQLNFHSSCLKNERGKDWVDLNFLGEAGGAYPSAIQALLPRLLAAAAPPGNTSHENRKQCLKVQDSFFTCLLSPYDESEKGL